jgi:hypothetical protein
VNETLFLEQGRELENAVSLEYLLLKEKGPLEFTFTSVLYLRISLVSFYILRSLALYANFNCYFIKNFSHRRLAATQCFYCLLPC